MMIRQITACLCAGLTLCCASFAADLPQTIATIKPSVVAIATFQKTRSPAVQFVGTGFVVADGLKVVTNAHVVAQQLNIETMESFAIVIKREDKEPEVRSAEKILVDKEHDIAILKISGSALPTLKMADSDKAVEGQEFAFTGYPLGMVLGLNPVTHRGLLSSITPIIQPAHNSRQLDIKVVKQLQKPAYKVFQLDATAYPGNSGSPLYDPQTGEVYGILNSVFIKGIKENATSQPSGISYAIPAVYIQNLLQQVTP